MLFRYDGAADQEVIAIGKVFCYLWFLKRRGMPTVQGHLGKQQVGWESGT